MKKDKSISYEMSLVNTEDSTGYFSCIPSVKFEPVELFKLLCERPMDSFLHKYAIDIVSSMTINDFKDFFESRDRWSDYEIAVFLEASFINSGINSFLSNNTVNDAAHKTPLINLKVAALTDRNLHFKWISKFKNNIFHHIPVQKSNDKFPCLPESPKKQIPISIFYNNSLSIDYNSSYEFISAASATKIALEKLELAGISVDSEMRHVSSLSPVALLRKWKLGTKTESGRNCFELSGIHTAYGKGLVIDDARVSCVMEIIERLSSYASVKNDSVIGYQNDYPLIKAPFSEISKNFSALNPNLLMLEAPYDDESLWWISGQRVSSNGLQNFYVPAQTIFLFSNFDEIELFSGIGSTGLAAHTDMTMAKITALLECVERDCDTISLFEPSECFKITSRNFEINRLLSAYASLGIDIYFQNITSAIGIPCYRCFVKTKDGQIVKGTGAGLNGGKAAISALLETPYPFPYSQASARSLHNLPVLFLEELPDFTTGNPCQELDILEKTLSANGFFPVYADLTRADIGLPVVRAIIPGFEIMNDFDEFSRISPRIMSNYLKTVSMIP